MSATEERSNPSPNEGTDSIPDDLLPPVEAPSAGFILQLFVIPLIIVAIIILVFFFLNHMAHMGSSPNETVRKLKKGDDAAWQQAVNLSNMFRNSKNEHLKHDSSLCLELADVLEAMGDLQGATGALDRAIYIYPFDMNLHRRLAEAYADVGEPTRAIRERRAVLALDPIDRPEALYQLALAYFGAADLSAARRTVLQALEDAPNFEKAQDLLLEIRAALEDGR